MDKEAKQSLTILHHNEGKSASEISKILSINRCMVYLAIKRYKETGSTQDRFRKGGSRPIRTPAVKKFVRKKDRTNPIRSIQGMAKTPIFQPEVGEDSIRGFRLKMLQIWRSTVTF
ncbi:hypothetical protein LOD99_5403 [Oopsacas minuta]|uniref:Paired domain-containing protein n=1 Tax=Oopsacas minuta TaxID=111878 RepID=A0AAV7JRF2_9METZ|nr:hypothetical protein LOD99_5403 [Oopsacas minuta]